MTATDLARLESICAALPAGDAQFLRDLAARAVAPWQARAARLTERDRLIRESLTIYAGWRESRAAEELAAELRRAAACPNSVGERANLLRRILGLNNGRSLAWRQIINVMNGQRGGNLQEKHE